MINKRIGWTSWGVVAILVGVCFSPTAMARLSRDEKRELKSIHKIYENNLTDELSESLSLEEALQYGSLYNAALRGAFYQWKASTHDIKQATSLEDPEISFQFYVKEIESREDSQKQMYSISQKIPFPGKLYTEGQAATAMSRQKHADYQKVKLQYYYEVKDAYLEYWFLYKNILVTEKNKELLAHFEGVAQSKFKSSLTTNQDLLKAQVELGKLENDLLTLNDYREPIVARLNAVLNRSVEVAIAWPEEIRHKIEALDEQFVFEKLVEHNPDLEKAAQRIEEAKKKVLLARLDYLPDTMVAFDYFSMAKGPMDISDNGKDEAALMFTVNVPLWYGKQKSQADEADALKKSAESYQQQVGNNLAAKIKMVYFKIKNAERQINLYRNALIPKAEQSLKASESAYSSGGIDFLNLIDSQRTLLNFQLSYYKAIRDYEQRFAELEMMVGESLRGQNNGK